MLMNTALCLGLQDAVVSRKPRGILIHRHRAAAVGDVDAMRAIAFHEQRLLRQRIGRRHMAHHKEARDIHAKAPRRLDMLLRDVGRSEEPTSELQSLMRNPYAVFCSKKKTT